MATTAPGQMAEKLAPVYVRAGWRMLPFLMLIYALGYVDRVNVSYAQLYMGPRLGFDAEIYGFGAGILFISFALFEVPSNMLLARFGAKRILSAIMVLWGLASTCTALVSTPMEFYVVRFMVGLFEAGLFPGVVLYLSYWFPSAHRGRILAAFLLCVPVASALSGPLSGWILEAWDGVYGIENWQWLFILEGLPSVALGFLAFFVLTDRPSEARWLSDDDKMTIEREIAEDEALKPQSGGSHKALFTDFKIYVLSFADFCLLCGYFAVSFWLPMILKANGVTNALHIGLYATIPHILSGIVMFYVGRHSDLTRERTWHFAVPLLIAAVGLAFSVWQTESLAISLVALCVALAGVMCCFPTIWAAASDYLPKEQAPVGIALISGLGASGGFISPYIVGYIVKTTGSQFYSFLPIVALMVLGALAMVFYGPGNPGRRAEA